MSVPWVIEGRTRDGTRSKFAGAGRWQEDNGNDDHGTPGREDYSVALDDAAPAVTAREPLRPVSAWRVEARTRDRTRSIFAGAVAFVEDNRQDDHGRAGREDYSVDMSGGHKPIVVQGWTGTSLDYDSPSSPETVSSAGSWSGQALDYNSPSTPEAVSASSGQWVGATLDFDEPSAMETISSSGTWIGNFDDVT